MNKLFKKALAISALLLGVSLSANAQYENFQTMEMGKTYNSPIQLKFTAPSDGKLIATQPSFDSFLFNGIPASASDYSTIIPSDGYIQSTSGGYDLPYNLVKGQTVYFIAPNDVTGNISSVTFTWDGADTSGIKDVVLNEAFNCNSVVYQYTPSVSGIMEVWMQQYSLEVVQYDNLVYSDANCSVKVAHIGGEDYGDEPEDGGVQQYLATYYVHAGQTYYFKSPVSMFIKVLGVIEKEQSIIINTYDMLPQPGLADWRDGGLSNYANGFAYNFSPADVKVASATVTYTNASGETVTVNFQGNDQLDYMGGNWIVRLYDTLLALLNNGTPYTFFTVTLNNITYNGQRMPVEFSDYDAVAGYASYDSATGSVTFKYMIPGDPMEYKSELSKWPTTIYESWTPGDPDGYATLIFNYNINTTKYHPSVTVTLGSQTWNSTGGGDIAPPSADVPYTVNNNVLTLDFTQVTLENPEGYNANGKCTIFVTGIYDIYGQAMPMPAVDQKLPYVASAAPAPSVTLMEPGSQLTPGFNPYLISVDEFVIQWSEYELAPTGSAMNATVYIDQVQKGTAPITITQGPNSTDSETDCLTIDMSAYANQTGQFMVMIPQGIVKDSEGNINPEQYITCSVYPVNNNYTFTPTAGTNVDQGGQILLTFNGGVVINERCDEPVEWANSRLQVNTLENSLVIPVYEETPLGTTTLTVPATFLIINGDSLNDEIVAEFIVVKAGTSAIESLRDENGSLDIYDLSGRKVTNPGKGLYIINGKKVIIK